MLANIFATDPPIIGISANYQKSACVDVTQNEYKFEVAHVECSGSVYMESLKKYV